MMNMASTWQRPRLVNTNTYYSIYELRVTHTNTIRRSNTVGTIQKHDTHKNTTISCSSSSTQRQQSSSTVASNANNNIIVHNMNEFRRGVGLCVVNQQGLVFAARRMDDSAQTWQMPQGGIDPMENPLVAAKRELKEETGMTRVRVVGSIDGWLDYEYPTKVKSHVGDGYLRYRGQTQKWLLMEFEGDDDEIDLTCHGSPEFSEWRWMPLHELPEKVVDFKRDVYRRVLHHFEPRIECLVQARKNTPPRPFC